MIADGGEKMKFGTLLTAMITPFDQDLKVDYEQAGKVAEHLAATGSTGIVIAGTTGESPTLTSEEKQKLLAVVRECVGDQVAVVMGAGTNATASTIAEIKQAKAGGADGVMLVVPYYNKPTQEGLYQHFKAAAESSDLPVILYNIPGRTGCNLLPETVERLAEIPQIVAVKEASGNLAQIAEIRRRVPKDFLIYSGDDALTLPVLSVGGNGIISVAAHVVGREIADMMMLWQSGAHDQAVLLHNRLLPVYQAMFLAPNPGPVKYAMERYGFSVNHLRLPMTSVTEQEKKQIDLALDRFYQEDSV